MNPRLARLHVRLYPRPWRDRYGTEFEAFLQGGPGGLRASANLLRSALSERIAPTIGGNMDQHPQSFQTLSRQPSAYLPMAMSLAALAVMWVGPRIFGDLHVTDEGPTAHLWQLLMAGQVPVVLFFAVKWLRRAPGQTLKVLAIQATAVLANMAVVFLLGVG